MSTFKRRRLRGCVPVVALVAAALLVGAGSAAACPCSEFCGSVIDHGSTPTGVPWRITAFERGPIGSQPATGEFQFSTGVCGSDEMGGYFAGFALPISRRFGFSALTGNGSEGSFESNLSGVTSGRAVTLVLGLEDGTSLTIHPQRAPLGLRRRWPWLRRVRVFQGYFPAGPRPATLTACDREGRVIARGSASRFHSFEAALGTGVKGAASCAT